MLSTKKKQQRWQPFELLLEADAPSIAQQLGSIGRPYKPERVEEFQAAANAILCLETTEIIDRAEFVRLRAKLALRIDGHTQGFNMKGTPAGNAKI